MASSPLTLRGEGFRTVEVKRRDACDLIKMYWGDLIYVVHGRWTTPEWQYNSSAKCESISMQHELRRCACRSMGGRAGRAEGPIESALTARLHAQAGACLLTSLWPFSFWALTRGKGTRWSQRGLVWNMSRNPCSQPMGVGGYGFSHRPVYFPSWGLASRGEPRKKRKKEECLMPMNNKYGSRHRPAP